MTGTIRTTTVDGKNYKVYGDFIKRCTIAEDENGTKKAISANGYISNDLTVRKAIAIHFGHKTFRK